MAAVTKSEVRNLTNIEDEEVLENDDLGELIDLAVKKVDKDTQGKTVDPGIRNRLELLYSAHLVKLKMRGATAIISDGDVEIEELDAEAGTIYSQMYDREIPSSKSVQFSHVG